MTSSSRHVPSRWFAPLAGLLATALAACSGSASVDLVDQAPGQVGLPAGKPGSAGDLYDGSLYLVDPHEGGKSTELRLVSAAWGRLVDVFDLDATTGQSRLVYPDFVIGQDVRTEPGKWTVAANPITGSTRFTILVKKTDVSGDPFDLLLEEARNNLSPVPPKGLQPGELPPFPLVARNSTLELQFSDLLDPTSVIANDTVRILTGNPPTVPFPARILPSVNHGGVTANGQAFQSTRILVDLTISELEAQSLSVPAPLNGLGLPASQTTGLPNVALRFPTALAPAAGQFQLLRNLKGTPLSLNGNGAVDTFSPTLDVVRALRSGSPVDPNNGFLLDLDPPRILGQQPITVTSASPDPSGSPGYDFIVSFQFATPLCSFNPVVGDALQFPGGLTVEATLPGSANPAGAVNGLRVRAPILGDPISAGSLIGPSNFLTAYRSELGTQGKGPCFVRFTPVAKSPPVLQVPPQAGVVLRFSEAMDPASLRPFDSMRVVRLGAGQLSFKDYVVGEIFSSGDQREFRFQPSLPFEHGGSNEPSYFLNLVTGTGLLTDLAGNALQASLPQVEFKIEPTGVAVNSKGFVLRFNDSTLEEVAPNQNPPQKDIRGQFLYDNGGFLRPRLPVRFGAIADRSQALVGIMQPIPTGVVTPLSALGSKLQHLWRYADFGYSVSHTDASLLELDVEGLALAPLTGQVVAANYPQFEIRLTHSRYLPDEEVDPNSLLPLFIGSGPKVNYQGNILQDPLNEQRIVHERSKGFVVSQSDVFQSANGVPLLRMPLNEGLVTDAEKSFYTWRDTTIQGRGGFNDVGTIVTPTGIPFLKEVNVVFGGANPGPFFQSDFAGIPSVGLPLLIEYRCFPAETSSLNIFDISIALNSSALPAFRAFSTGGVNTSGNAVQKNPDTENSATGGFQAVPNSTPGLGQPTVGIDPTFYIGQADVVLRISRVYTRLVDTVPNPLFRALVVEPRPDAQPAGTSLQFAWRGLSTLTAAAEQAAARNADNLDVYGNVFQNTAGDAATFPGLASAPWITSLDALSQSTGLRFLQTRVTFISNTQTQLSPRLDSYALAYSN